MPSSSPKQQAQQGSPNAGDRSRSASHDEGGGGRVKLESPFQEAGQGDAPALAGEESDAHGVGEDAEEEEVESAVKGRAQGGEQRAEPVEGQGGRDDAEAGRMRVNWAEERLEDEIRPLDMHTAFTRPLLKYKAQQADVVQNYVSDMAATLLESQVWAFLYLRSLADSQAAVLETATARMAEEEIFQEETRKGLLLVKEQVKDAMDRLKNMQSLALVRVRRRSESVDPGTSGGARKKIRTA